jgi:hypothetical protein
MLSGVPNLTWSPDFELFTIGLPREEGPYGEVMHLADRHRHAWKLPGDDSDRYISPYSVAGFAGGGKWIVAFDDTRLFALPVAAIQAPENEITRRRVQPKRPAKPSRSMPASAVN